MLTPDQKRLSVGLAIFATLTSTGLYLVMDHPIWGSVLLFGGTVGFAYAVWEKRGRVSNNRTWPWILALALTWAGIAYDYYDRKSTPDVPSAYENHDPVLQWGTDRPRRAFAVVDNKLLVKVKDKDNALLIIRASDSSVDFKFDTAIAKSQPFSIVGEIRTLAMDLPENVWKKLFAGSGLLDIYVAVIPKSVTVEQIRCLNDVERLGGITVGAKEVNALSQIGPPAPIPQ